MFSAYAVVEDAGYKDRLYLGHFESEQSARNKVRDAIASGCIYGYVKDGHDVVAYLTVESFVVRGLVEKSKTDSTGANRRKRVRTRPLFRVE